MLTMARKDDTAFLFAEMEEKPPTKAEKKPTEPRETLPRPVPPPPQPKHYTYADYLRFYCGDSRLATYWWNKDHKPL